MAQIAARHKLLILDSCYAGELFREPLRPNDPSAPRSEPRVIRSTAVAAAVPDVAAGAGGEPGGVPR